MFLVMMYIFFAGLMLCQVGAQQPGILDVALNEIPETDDDRLNQALLLVDILKSEYLKLLRVRSESATKDASTIDQSSSVSVGTVGPVATDDSIIWTENQDGEMPVSRPNTLGDTPREQARFPAMMYTAGPPHPWGGPAPGIIVPSRRFYDMMPQPVRAVYPNFQRRNMGRNLPEYYAPKWLKDLPEWLRNAKNDLTTATDRLTSTVTEETAAASRRNYQNARKSSNTETSNIVEASENNKTTSASKSLNQNSMGPTPNETTTITTSNNNSRLQHLKQKVTTASATSPTEKWPAFFFKSTMRVFLENSTPLPIPLPENNAFCFTNPRNAMCRSI